MMFGTFACRSERHYHRVSSTARVLCLRLVRWKHQLVPRKVKTYSVAQAVDLMREEKLYPYVKKPSRPSYFAHVLINLRSKIDRSALLGFVTLPHGMGHRKVGVWTSDPQLVQRAQEEYGVLHAGGIDLVDRIKEWKYLQHLFSRLVTTKEMQQVYENDPDLFEILKQENLVPSTLNMTLVESEELLDIVAKHQQRRYMPYRINHLSRTTEIRLGYMGKHSSEQVTDNLHALIRHLFDRKEELYGKSFRCRKKDEGKYIIRVNLSRTAGRTSYRINLPKLLVDMGLFEEAKKIHYYEKTTWQEREAWGKRQKLDKIEEVRNSFWKDCVSGAYKSKRNNNQEEEHENGGVVPSAAELQRIAQSDKETDRAMNELASVGKSQDETARQHKDGIMLELAKLAAGTDWMHDDVDEQFNDDDSFTMDFSKSFPVDALDLDEEDALEFAEILTNSPSPEVESKPQSFDNNAVSMGNLVSSPTENAVCMENKSSIESNSLISENINASVDEKVSSTRNRADEILEEIAALVEEEEEEEVFPIFQFSSRNTKTAV